MDREPVSRWMRQWSLVGAALTVLGLSACQDDEFYEGAFDMPVAAAVLQPEAGGPFQQPIGMVANGIGGNLIPLDLKYGRFLTVRPTASFLRTPWLPTGRDRVLGSVAIYAPTPDEVTVYAGDQAFGVLLRVPFIAGLDADGFPLPGWIDEGGARVDGPVVGEVRIETEGNVRVEEIEPKVGWTTTETWAAIYNEVRDGWEVIGSRSGLQRELAMDGERWVGDRRRLAFTLHGQGQAGDRIEIDTDSGVEELDVGGIPTALAMAPDQSILAMVVTPPGDANPSLQWLDPGTGTVVGEVALPPDARPARLEWTLDGEILFASDAGRPAVWEIPREGAPTEHVLPWPTLDMTPMFSEDDGRLLYVVPLDAREVWIYNLDTGTFNDVNTAVPGVQGMAFHSPVTGVAAIPVQQQFQERNHDGVRRTGRSVAVSLFEGKVVFMEEAVGCLLQDDQGPQTSVSGGLGAASDVNAPFQSQNPLGAYLERNLHNPRHVLVNPCAGIARAETWTLRFDRNQASWVVEGSVSGVQSQSALEDERYLSDRGEVSLVVRAGAQPSQEGWEMTFQVLDGVLAAVGAFNEDEILQTPLDVPGEPVFFHYTVGPQTEPWQQVDRRGFVLVPGQGSDMVGRVNPQEGRVEVRWN